MYLSNPCNQNGYIMLIRRSKKGLQMEDFPTLFYYYWLVIWTKSKPEQKKLAQRFVLRWCILSWKMGFSVRAVSLYDMINGPANNVLMSGLVKLKNVLECCFDKHCLNSVLITSPQCFLLWMILYTKVQPFV